MENGQNGVDGLIVIPLVEKAKDPEKETVIHQSLKTEEIIARVPILLDVASLSTKICKKYIFLICSFL